MLCNGDYTNCKHEAACLPSHHYVTVNIYITNGLATSNALINKHSVRNTQSRVFMH